MFSNSGKTLLLTFYLSACGGATDNPLSTGKVATPTTPKCLTLCEIVNFPITSSMPSGSASYSGKVGYLVVSGDGGLTQINSDLSIFSDFNLSTATLRLNNFHDGNVITGEAKGTAIISGSSIAGSIYGEIQKNGVNNPLQGQLSGNFRGETANAVSGSIVINGESHGGAPALGSFAAEVQ